MRLPICISEFEEEAESGRGHASHGKISVIPHSLQGGYLC